MVGPGVHRTPDSQPVRVKSTTNVVFGSEVVIRDIGTLFDVNMGTFDIFILYFKILGERIVKSFYVI